MRYEVTIVYKNNSIKKVFCNAETKEEVDVDLTPIPDTELPF